MSAVLLPGRSWVLLDLDTTPPVLAIDAAGVVQPPEDLVVTVTSSEPVGTVEAEFRDPLGARWPVGVALDGPGVLRLTVGTTGMSTGAGLLHLLVRDLAGNATEADWPVFVDRPAPFSVTGWTEPLYALRASEAGPFEVEAETGSVFALRGSTSRG